MTMTMKQQEPINTPLLAGWTIAIGAGAVAFGVSLVVVNLDGNGAVFVSAVVALVVGLILGLPSRPLPAPNTMPAPGARIVPGAAPNTGPPTTMQQELTGTPAPALGTPSPAPAPVAAPAAAVAAPAPTSATPVSPPPASPPPVTSTPVSAPVAGAVTPEGSGTRPTALAAARGGVPDDLKRIRGVGPKLETLLHSLGIYHFDQIAAWSEAELAWVDSHLEGFYGRASRDEWVPQARILAAGGETGFTGGQE